MTPLASPTSDLMAPLSDSGLLVRPYRPGLDDAAWDGLVARSVNGTFLHTRRFLSYHGNRFADRSLVVEGANGRLHGVLPAAVDPDDTTAVVSHPGITYGGLVHDGVLYGSRNLQTFEGVRRAFAADGATRFRYKPVPRIYHRVPAEDDLYTMFRLGARCARRDLSATVDLGNRRPVWKRRRQRRRAAEQAGITAMWGWDAIGDYWPIQQAVLQDRFGVAPTHTRDEIDELAKRFPTEIRLVTARLGGDVVAGGIVFSAPPVLHLQYSASNPEGRACNAIDVVVETTIDLALAAPSTYRYYSFGISNEDGGWRLNDSLYEFKLSFGSGAVVYEQFEVDL